MARTDSRGGHETRDRIAGIASGLFSDRGFDGVTVAEVARSAGVSSVTVFKYFPKKEDLFFDRTDEIAELLLGAARERAASGGLAPALQNLFIHLLDQQHPVSGVDERSVAFFRTVAGSPVLIGRARQIAADLQHRLARELESSGFDGDAQLASAFIVAGYARILTETARELIDGGEQAELARHHRARIARLVAALEHGPLTPVVD